MDSVSRVLYNTVFRRNSTYLAYILAGGFAAERIINRGGDYVWEHLNKGKLWKDVLAKKEAGEQ